MSLANASTPRSAQELRGSVALLLSMLAVLLLALAAAGPARATGISGPHLTTDVFAQVELNDATGGTTVGPPALILDSEVSVPDPITGSTETAFAHAAAAYGLLRAEATTTSTDNTNFYRATAFASFVDTITISNQECADSEDGFCPLTVSLVIVTTGLLTQSADDDGEQGLSFYEVNLTTPAGVDSVDGAASSGSQPVLSIITTDPFPVNTGEEFDVELGLQVEVDGLGTADFFGTTEISQIIVTGAPSSSGATGTSGTDYSALIPEPSTLSLLGLGIAGIAVRRRLW